MGALLSAGGGLLIDLDGTLVDSEPAHAAAFASLFAARGWEVDSATIRQFAGRRGQDAFATLDGPWRDEDPEALTRETFTHLRQIATVPTPIAGARAMVETWLGRGVPCAIVTSATRWWCERALSALGLGMLPAITAEAAVHGKPSPEPYLRGAALIERQPAQCVVLEDSRAGVESARAAGAGLVVGVATGMSGAQLLRFGADVVVPDLTPLAAEGSSSGPLDA